MAQHTPPLTILHAMAGGPHVPRTMDSCVISSARVNVLKGHEQEAFLCAWNPKRDILASGSADATVRLWDLTPQRKLSDSPDSIVLSHELDVDVDWEIDNTHKDITALEWSPDGSLLLTGSHIGFVRLWDIQGELQKHLKGHQGLVYASKWNKKGNRFLTASADKTVIMWHADGILSQKFEFHTAAVVNVDWQSDVRFASCSKDSTIYVCELDQYEPLHTFFGHCDDVNDVKWDSEGKILASGSDDMTLKLWSMNSTECLDTLTGHTKEVYRIAWRPSGSPAQLASASFDRTVCVWDVTRGKAMLNLTKFTDRVFSVAYSPDGRFIATGAYDNCVQIWCAETGLLLQVYRSTDSIFEVCWNSEGTKVAASGCDGAVTVLDLRYNSSEAH